MLISGCWIFKPDPPKPPTRPDLPTSQLIGQDWLAAQHPNFNLGVALETLPPETHAVGTLDWTFGETLSPIELILGSGKVAHYRVHFFNGPCVRNKNCGGYEPTAGMDINKFNQRITARDHVLLSHFRGRVGQYCSFIDRYPSVRFYFSWVLEHNLSVEAWNVLDEEGRAACARNDYYVVNNPVGSHNFPRYPRSGVLYEDHGDHPQPGQVTSLDGEEVTDINVPPWLGRTASYGLVFNWSRAYNCRPVEPFIDPRARTNCPDGALHEELIHVTDARPAAPSGKPPNCTTNEPFIPPLIWKPLAENYGDRVDARGNKPVAITRFNSSLVDIVAINGSKVGSLRYYGTFQGGLFRHYSGMPGASNVGGYEFEKRAVAASGSPYVWVRDQNGRCAGPFVPGRRAGVYR